MDKEKLNEAMLRAWCEYRNQEYIEGNVRPLPSDNFEHGYMLGRRDALAGQWRSVEDELPDEGTEVLCLMKSNGAIVSGFITKRWHPYPEVATDTGFHFEDYGGYECTHWMPLPPDTPEDDEQP